MRTYNSNNTGKKQGFFARYLYPIVLGATVLAVGSIIALSVWLAPTDGKTPIDEEPVANTPVYVLPIKDAEVLAECVLTRLVYQPTLNQWRTHNGVDFVANKGDEVVSVRDGVVEKVEATILEGVVITIKHEGGITSTYKSLGSAAVEEGQSVIAGQLIGTVGDPMVIEVHAGVHLHFEMRLNNKLVDPFNYLPAINK